MFTHKKKLLVFIVSALVLTAGSCTRETNSTGNVPKSNITGKAFIIEGEVTIDGKSAETGDIIKDGDVISTSGDSYCEVTFLGGNIIRIYENSLMKISFSEAMISLERGTAAAVLRNISSLLKKETELFEVESGNVVAGIRGTSFFLTKEDADTTYFCLCNGSITVHDTNQTLEMPLTAIHHKAIRLRESRGSVSMSQAEMAYHTDEDMEHLAAQIGRKMDWTTVEK